MESLESLAMARLTSQQLPIPSISDGAITVYSPPPKPAVVAIRPGWFIVAVARFVNVTLVC